MTSEQAIEEAEKLGKQIGSAPPEQVHTETVPQSQPAPGSKRQGILVDASMTPGSPSEAEIKRQVEMDRAIRELDAHVTNALRNKREWLEYNGDVITYLCGGITPVAGYMTYKSIRLCMPGMAEEIARRERLTINELWYVEDGKLYAERK